MTLRSCPRGKLTLNNTLRTAITPRKARAVTVGMPAGHDGQGVTQGHDANLLAGALKPASDGRMKTSHFEERRFGG